MTAQKLGEVKKYMEEKMREKSHNLHHLERVSQEAARLAQLLPEGKELDLNLLQAMGYLHDVTYITHHTGFYSYFFEKYLVRRALKGILAGLKIEGREAELIATACANHPHSFPLGNLNRDSNLYTQLLQDADTLDFFNYGRWRVMHARLDKIPLLGNPLVRVVEKVLDYGKKNIRRYLNLPALYGKE